MRVNCKYLYEFHCDMHTCTHMHIHTMFDLLCVIDEAVQAFVNDLQASPKNGADLAQNLISRLQKGSMVRKLWGTPPLSSNTCVFCFELYM